METSKHRVGSYFELGDDGSGIPRPFSSGTESHPVSHLQELPGTTSPSPSQTDRPSCLKHHAKSQATGQKTQLFSAVTLLNLIFPASSPSLCLLRERCIFGLYHMVLLHAARASHSAEVICTWAAPPTVWRLLSSIPGRDLQPKELL